MVYYCFTNISALALLNCVTTYEITNTIMGYLNIIRDIIDITCHKLYDINYSANISSINSKILSMFLDPGYWISDSLWGIWWYMLIYEIYAVIRTFYGISIYIFSVINYARWCPPSHKSFLIIPWTSMNYRYIMIYGDGSKPWYLVNPKIAGIYGCSSHYSMYL